MTLKKMRLPLILLASAGFLLAASSGVSQTPQQKVIVIGFDGVDAKYTEKWMDEGELPNLARLREQGTFKHLLPTLPAQTPVSWSTFATGMNPGRTGIFDFLRRDPATYLPVFAAFDEIEEPFLLGERTSKVAGLVGAIVGFLFFWLIGRVASGSRLAWILGIIAGVGLGGGLFWAADKYLPTTKPGVINRRQGIPMWEVAGEAGKKVRVVRVPVTFPATDFKNGHLLSGLGVPDLSGRVGKPFYFTSELNFNREGANEFSIDVVQLEDNRGSMDVEIVGPPNKLFDEPPYISTTMNLSVADARDSVTLKLAEQVFTLKPGEWSD